MTTLRSFRIKVTGKSDRNIDRLFDANRLVELALRPIFTFEVRDESGQLELSLFDRHGVWTDRAEVALKGRILHCEPLDARGRHWRLKVEFVIKIAAYGDGFYTQSAEPVTTFLKFDNADRSVVPDDKKFVAKFMRWLEPYEGSNDTPHLWFTRRIGRIAPPKSAEELMGNFPIEELEIRVHAYNALKRVGIETFGDLTSKTERELRSIPGFGDRDVASVKEALQPHGLQLKQ